MTTMSQAPKVYKYLIDSSYFIRPKIERVECIKETKAYVEIIPNKQSKYRSTFRLKKHGRVYDTWKEAHEVLMARAHSNLNSARLNLQAAQGLHVNIVGMKPPADETTTTTTQEPSC
jgi:hypothetical protein